MWTVAAGPQLRALEASPVTRAAVMGGTISIAEGRVGLKCHAAPALPWRASLPQCKRRSALNLIQPSLEDQTQSPREDVTIPIAVELFCIDYT